jgi:hypothetical protein
VHKKQKVKDIGSHYPRANKEVDIAEYPTVEGEEAKVEAYVCLKQLSVYSKLADSSSKRRVCGLRGSEE